MPYEDELYEDESALEATDYDPPLAGAYRMGRQARGLMLPESANACREVLASSFEDLAQDMGGRLSKELLQQFRRGFG